MEDLEEGFGLGALGVLVEGLVVVGRGFRGGFEEVVEGEGGAAHGALGLHVDDFGDAAAAEDVLAVGDDGVVHVFHADGAFFLAFDDELEGLLEEGAVLVAERDDVLVFEEREEVGDALFAERPVVARLAETEESFEDGLEAAFLAVFGAGLELL